MKENVQDVMALTPLQSGILYECLSSNDPFLYVEQISIMFNERIDYENFTVAWSILQEWHAALRTVFKWRSSKMPVQIVLKNLCIPISVENEGESRGNLYDYSKLRDGELAKGLDLDTGPLMRILLVNAGPNSSEMTLTYHHIIMDGWSLSIILRDFCYIYDRLCKGEPVAAPIREGFSSHVKRVTQRDPETDSAFWTEYLKGFHQASNVPFDALTRPNATNQNGSGSAVVKGEFSIPETSNIQRFCESENSTLSSLVYMVWGIILARYSDLEDVMFGTTVSGRTVNMVGMENSVGLYINTIPLRLQAPKHQTAKSLLSDVQRNVVSRHPYEHTPLSRIKDCLDINGSLFDSIVVFENYPTDWLADNRDILIFPVKETVREKINYSIVVEARLIAAKLSISVQYDPSKFAEDFVRGIVSHFKNITMEIVNNANVMIEEIIMLSAEEIDQFYSKVNFKPLSKRDSLHALFEHTVTQYPERGAVRYNGRDITYSELNQNANRLCHYLKEHGVAIGSRIAVMMEVSGDAVTAILGVLKAGAVYVPIDPELPEERIATMLCLIKPTLIVTDQESGKLAIEYSERVLSYSVDFLGLNTDNPQDIVSGSDLAYEMFTSGSTGAPKGVLIEHRSIVNTVTWRIGYYSMDTSDSILQISSWSFDSSIEDIFCALCSGAKLVLISRDEKSDYEKVGRFITDNYITHMLLTPSLYRSYLQFIPQALSKLRFVTVAGEPCTDTLVNLHYEIASNVRLFNEYGPSENSVCTSVSEVIPGIRPSIGQPISNVACYIINSVHGTLQPVGVPGELCISGYGLMRGYEEYSTENNNVFIFHPIIGKMYKTGDIARWSNNGCLSYLGRRDEQVKIRGMRVELQEIESVFMRIKGIVEVAVVCTNVGNQQLVITAYVVINESFVLESVYQKAREILPAFMIPNEVIVMGSLPRLYNGKLDKRTLESACSNVASTFLPSSFDTPTKITLRSIWSTVLQHSEFGSGDKFMEVKGDSIRMMELVFLVNRTFSTNISISDLFRNPTIDQMSKLLDGDSGMKGNVPIFRLN